MRWPRPVEPFDRLLAPGGQELPLGALACFYPVLPPQASCDPETWTALRVRCDERWREHQGPIGDAVRALVAKGVLQLGDDGLLLDPVTGEPLTEGAEVPEIVGSDGEQAR